MKTVRTIAELRAALEPLRADAARSASCRRWAPSTTGHLALLRAARAECDAVVASLFVNPAQFGAGEDLAATRATRRATPRIAERGRASTSSSRPRAEEIYPPGFQTWVEVEELSHVLEGAVPPRPLPRRRDGLPEALHHRPPATAPTSARRTRSRSRSSRAWSRDLDLDARDPRRPDRARRRTASRSRPATRCLAPGGAASRARAIPRALADGAEAHRAGGDAAAAASEALDASRSSTPYVEVAASTAASSSPPPPASAPSA